MDKEKVTNKNSKQKPTNKARLTKNSTYYRAENEDDDGYDPYSDRPAVNPLFEKDPWR